MKKNAQSNPQSEQLQKLQELGSRLCQIRTEQGLSLKIVAEQTHIRLPILRAIEEGRIDLLPEPVYLRGLLKRFADSLGLNGTEFANEFPTEDNSRLFKAYWLPVYLPRLRPVHLYMLYVILVIFSVRWLAQLVEPSSKIQIIQIETLATTTSEPSKATSVSPLHNQAQVTALQQSDPTQPVVVEITLKDESWLRVVVDGKKEFEGILREGTHRTWMANQELTILASNAGGVMVALNEQEAKQLGQPGQVEEITYKAPPHS